MWLARSFPARGGVLPSGLRAFSSLHARGGLSRKADEGDSVDKARKAALDGKAQPHINEESVATAAILGQREVTPQEMEGVPAADVIKGDPEAEKHAPAVLKGQINTSAQKRSFASWAPAHAEVQVSDALPEAAAPVPFTSSLSKQEIEDIDTHPIVRHLVGMILRDGKKSQARRRVQDALLMVRLRTQQPPLPLLEQAVTAIEPLFRLGTMKRAAKSFPYPVALNEKQRRRRALAWILEGSDKRSSRVFSERLAQELLAVLDGSSTAYGKRTAVHQQGLINRANMPNQRR